MHIYANLRSFPASKSWVGMVKLVQFERSAVLENPRIPTRPHRQHPTLVHLEPRPKLSNAPGVLPKHSVLWKQTGSFPKLHHKWKLCTPNGNNKNNMRFSKMAIQRTSHTSIRRASSLALSLVVAVQQLSRRASSCSCSKLQEGEKDMKRGGNTW